jgi:hypothetical protein
MAVDVSTARLEATKPLTDPSAPSFSLGTLLIAMGWICVLLALGKVAIEIAVILAVISLPALGRASWLVAEYQDCGKRVTGLTKCGLFLSSVCAISAAIAVGIGAGFMVLVIFAGAVVTVLEIFASEVLYVLTMLIMVPAFGGALAFGIWIGVQFEKLFRPRFLASKSSTSGQATLV